MLPSLVDSQGHECFMKDVAYFTSVAAAQPMLTLQVDPSRAKQSRQVTIIITA